MNEYYSCRQALCQDLVRAAMTEGGVIVVPIWLHNELRARHRVTDRKNVMQPKRHCGSGTNCKAVVEPIKDLGISF